MATYPDSSEIEQGTNETPVDPTNWNTFVDNINAITADLVDARGDGQAFPGTDHNADQSSDIDDILQAIKHMLAEIGGETNWYDAPDGSLKAHTHAVGQGGLIPWGSLGVDNVRKIELHPLYAGGVRTNSLRGAGASGNNTITITNDIDVVSYVGRQYYDGASASASLQDTYIVVRFTLPKDFTSWAASNAIQIEYKTGSALSSDCHVDVYVYKSGVGSVVCSSESNVNVSWSNIGISKSNIEAGPTVWAANDIVELYLKLESRNDHFARIGKIAFNYES